MGFASSLRSFRAKVRRSFAHRGLWGTLAYVPEFASYLARSLAPQRRRWEADALRVQQQFDRDFQVDTAGITQLSDLAVVGQHRDLGHYYHGTDPQVFQRQLEQLPIDHAQYSFIDYGSGKGKALLLASLWPFQAVWGVEFAEALHAVALRNIASFQHPGQRCRTLQSVHLDATQFELPGTPCVAYFYNPFSEVVLASILQKIQASLAAQPRDLWVCYTHPYAHTPLDQTPFLHLVQAHAHYRIYRAV
ncbi:hypothetical protein [Rhodoferax sp.]|uniref:hypothetical protein n=1 Tax=Rhodoferax sp. TaxID=50421 RepID=UPI0025E86711|nr:hypothetical protein [Rhodoferax sp.]